MSLNSFAENASKLGTRLQETLLEHVNELKAARGPPPNPLDVSEERIRAIRKQLESSSTTEKVEGLKTLIALIAKNRDVSEYFPNVVKNVASPNLEVRKLVYIYMMRFAQSQPDLALLSINTFQKDIADKNPLVRCMALRVLTGMKVPSVSGIILPTIERCAKDTNPYVRRVVAISLVKLYDMDESLQESLIPIVATLLRDPSPIPLGAVSVAFRAICPTRLDLLHQHYRRICRTVLDVDEWGQPHVLDLLLIYARQMLSKPVPATADKPGEVDNDLRLLLTCAEPLLMSRNPAVTMAVIRLYYYLAPDEERDLLVDPSLRLLTASKETQRAALPVLTILTKEFPNLYAPHYTRFYAYSTDATPTKKGKVHCLVNLISPENWEELLREFTDYALNADAQQEMAVAGVHAMGPICRKIPGSRQQVIKTLFDLIDGNAAGVVGAAVQQLQMIIEESIASKPAPTARDYKLLARLAVRIERIEEPKGRAIVLWLLGQYSRHDGERYPDVPSGIAGLAPDVLRLVINKWNEQDDFVKKQCLTTGTKLQLLFPKHPIIGEMNRFILDAGRADINFDIRDRTRQLRCLVSMAIDGFIPWEPCEMNEEFMQVPSIVLTLERVKSVMFDGKGLPTDSYFWRNGKYETIGSAELVLQGPMGLDSQRPVPAWCDEGTDSSLRDPEEDIPVVSLNITLPQPPPPDRAGSPGFDKTAQAVSGPEYSPIEASGSARIPATIGRAVGMLDEAEIKKELDKFFEEDDEPVIAGRGPDDIQEARNAVNTFFEEEGDDEDYNYAIPARNVWDEPSTSEPDDQSQEEVAESVQDEENGSENTVEEEEEHEDREHDNDSDP